MSDPETKPEPQPEFIIETFACGPNVKLNGIAAWLSRVAAEGFELVSAYAVPHPTGNMIVHHFVVQKRAELQSQPLVISGEAGRQLMAVIGRSEQLAPLEPATPAPTPTRGRRTGR